MEEGKLCPIHAKKFSKFCENCHTLLCGECLEEHLTLFEGHEDIYSIESVSMEAQSELNKLIKSYEMMEFGALKNLCKQAQDVDSFIHSLQEDELEMRHKTARGKIKKLGEKIKKKVGKLNSTLETIQEGIETDDHSALVQYSTQRKEYQNKLNEASSKFQKISMEIVNIVFAAHNLQIAQRSKIEEETKVKKTKIEKFKTEIGSAFEKITTWRKELIKRQEALMNKEQELRNKETEIKAKDASLNEQIEAKENELKEKRQNIQNSKNLLEILQSEIQKTKNNKELVVNNFCEEKLKHKKEKQRLKEEIDTLENQLKNRLEEREDPEATKIIQKYTSEIEDLQKEKEELEKDISEKSENITPTVSTPNIKLDEEEKGNWSRINKSEYLSPEILQQSNERKTLNFENARSPYRQAMASIPPPLFEEFDVKLSSKRTEQLKTLSLPPKEFLKNKSFPGRSLMTSSNGSCAICEQLAESFIITLYCGHQICQACTKKSTFSQFNIMCQYCKRKIPFKILHLSCGCECEIGNLDCIKEIGAPSDFRYKCKDDHLELHSCPQGHFFTVDDMYLIHGDRALNIPFASPNPEFIKFLETVFYKSHRLLGLFWNHAEIRKFDFNNFIKLQL